MALALPLLRCSSSTCRSLCSRWSPAATIPRSVPVVKYPLGHRLYSKQSESTPSYHNDGDPVIRLASLSLESSSSTNIQSLESLDPSSSQYAQEAKFLSEQESLRSAWNKFKSLDSELNSAQALCDESTTDPEMRTLAQEEISNLLDSLDSIRSTLAENLFPSDPIHSSGALIELRPGIGGEESCLFVGEMARMYEKWCNTHHSNWNVSTLSTTCSEFNGAMKEVILQIDGNNVYGTLRFEAGIHRVQRVPITTSMAKMQSSTITIVVLPLAKESRGSSTSNADDLVDPKDVKTEVMRSRGAGGQHVNKTESAIRLTHGPTGITVSMQDSRSQHANREKAWAILRSRLLDIKNKEKEQHERSIRGEQIGGLGRGDRIRTYNYPQDRVTDHRIQSNASSLDIFMEGTGDALQDFIAQLKDHERQNAVAAKLRVLQAGGP